MTTCSIRVWKPDTAELWEKNYTVEEFNEIEKKVKGSLEEYSRRHPLFASVVPLRTDNLKDFVGDFFLPNIVNYASKEKVPLPLQWYLLTLCLDLSTFFARCITLVPRIIYNSCRQEHSLVHFFKKEGMPAHIATAASIDVVFGKIIKPWFSEKRRDSDVYHVHLSEQPLDGKYLKEFLREYDV